MDRGTVNLMKMCRARIVIGIYNKNPESDIGVNAEDQRSRAARHQKVLLLVSMLKTKGTILSSDFVL